VNSSVRSGEAEQCRQSEQVRSDKVICGERGSAMAVRILLVDDHPIVRQGLRTLLEGRAEWKVVDEAADGVEAIEKVKTLEPDVVVLDVTMPQMNGIEVCRIIKQKKPAPEVLFVTQHDSPQMMREAMAVGAKGYVAKSNLARDLVDAVEAVSQHRLFTALAPNQSREDGPRQ
jgi:DNA-binding NarL/FixJ family response regulator